MKNLLIKYMMFVPGIVLLGISAVGFAFANEDALLKNAVELYKYDDPFGEDVALLYRPTDNPAGLAIFDLADSIITVIRHGPPQNCMELIISSAQGAIFAGCIKPVDIDKALN